VDADDVGCRNYYHSGGVNVTQWPGSHFKYYLTTRLAKGRNWCAAYSPETSAQSETQGAVRSC
jgi:hypothetical protein